MRIAKYAALGLLLITALSLAWGEAPPARPRAAPASGEENRLDLSAGGSFVPSYGSDQEPLAAFGCSMSLGFDLVRPRWIPFRGELSFFGVSDSAWSAELFRYRAFNGVRLSAEAGWRAFRQAGLELDLLAGGAFSASRFTGLDAVTAYASLSGEARALLPLGLFGLEGFRLSAAIPVEYLFRGAARTISAGAEIGLSFSPGKLKPKRPADKKAGAHE